MDDDAADVVRRGMMGDICSLVEKLLPLLQLPLPSSNNPSTFSPTSPLNCFSTNPSKTNVLKLFYTDEPIYNPPAASIKFPTALSNAVVTRAITAHPRLIEIRCRAP